MAGRGRGRGQSVSFNTDQFGFGRGNLKVQNWIINQINNDLIHF